MDLTPVLENGTGTPYLAIFKTTGDAIKDPVNGLPLGMMVTSFSYTFIEDNPDEGEFTVETPNEEVIDLPDLGYNMPLMLQWGWIFPSGKVNIGPLRKVMIVGHHTSFGTTGIKLTIKVSDITINLKGLVNQSLDQAKNWVDSLVRLFLPNKQGVQVIIDPETENVKGQHVVVQNLEGQVGTKTEETHYLGKKTRAPEYFTYSQTPSYNDKGERTNTRVKLLEYNAETEKLTIENPNYFHPTYLEDKVINGGGFIISTAKTQYSYWLDMLNAAMVPGYGPLHIKADPDNNGIIISNMLVNDAPIKEYTWYGGNGELLAFEVKDNFVAKAVQVQESKDINPDNKSVEGTVVQTIPDKNLNDKTLYATTLPWFQEKEKRKHIDPMAGGRFNHTIGWAEGIESSFGSQQTISAEEEYGPKDWEQYQQFPSEKDAQDTLSRTGYFDKEDIEKFLSQLKSEELEEGKDPNTTESLDRVLTSKGRYYKKKFKVVIVESVNLANYDPSPRIRRYTVGSKTPNMTEEVRSWERGYEHLKTRADVVEISEPRTNGYAHYATIYRTKEIEVAIDGVRLISSADFPGIASSFFSDLTINVTNQVTASATVIGRPSLESSQTFNILGVSKKYSGGWYSKKVKHTFTPSGGYICDIEFVLKKVPGGSFTYKTSVPINKAIKKINTELPGIVVKNDKQKAAAEYLLKENRGKEGADIIVQTTDNKGQITQRALLNQPDIPVDTTEEASVVGWVKAEDS